MSAVPSRPVLSLNGEVSPGAGSLAVSPGLFGGVLGRGRGIRVLMLAGLIATMSAIDLYITTMFLATTGMAEENPLARMIMSHGSLGYLSAWKVVSVLPALLLMIRYRHRVLIEMLGWAASAVLVCVMIRWIQYTAETDILMMALHAMPDCGDERWISLAATPTG